MQKLVCTIIGLLCFLYASSTYGKEFNESSFKYLDAKTDPTKAQELAPYFADVINRANKKLSFRDKTAVKDSVIKSKEVLFGRSCLKLVEGPASSRNYLDEFIDGISEILVSWDSNPPAYLSCMRKYGLGYYAAWIQGRFLSMIVDGVNRDEYKIFKKKLLNCSDGSEDFERSRTGKGEILFGYHKKESGEVTLHLGKYLLTAPIDDPNYGRYSGDVFQDFTPEQREQKLITKTLFHELLHHAGFNSEQFVHSLTDCCGDPQSGDSRACRTAENALSYARNVDAARALLSSNLVNYEEINDLINRNLSHVETEFIIRAVVGTFAEKLAQIEKDYQDCIGNNSTKTCNRQKLRTITDTAIAEYTKYIDDAFGPIEYKYERKRKQKLLKDITAMILSPRPTTKERR